MVPIAPENLALAYLDVKEWLINDGFDSEIDWQSGVSVEDVTETVFLREAAWVVLACGFKETLVRRLFPAVSAAFLDWGNAALIHQRSDECCSNALHVFGNRRKIAAIARIAELVATQGIRAVKKSLQAQGVTFLQTLPFMGPVTSLHLGKNLGLPVAKPDRHLLRIARECGYASPSEMCRVIADVVGDSIAVVDLVLWRCATLDGGYSMRVQSLRRLN